MKLAMKISKNQLALWPESEQRVELAGLSEQTREELLRALAELLLEALGEEKEENANRREETHESQAFQ